MTTLRFEQTIKDRDVEEPVDLYWHRPLAFGLLVRPLARWPRVGPAHVTWLSLLLGLAGAWTCYRAWDGWPAGFVLGALLVLGSVVADCADGMIARVRGGGSAFGMLLDGIVDLAVGLALWWALAWPTARLLGHAWWAWLLMVGVLLSTELHVALYDGYKNRFLAAVAPPRLRATGAEDEVPAWRRPGASRFERWVGAAYEHVYGSIAKRSGAERLESLPAERFRAVYGRAMRWASWLGLGTHLFVMYVAAAACALWPLAAFWVAVVTILVLGNLWTLAVLWAWRDAARRGRQEMRGGARGEASPAGR